MLSIAETEELIERAYNGVTLGNGVTLTQATVMSGYGVGLDGVRVSNSEFAQLRHKESRNDWRSIPTSLLDEHCCLSFLDAEGFRYYIPAFMVHILNSPTKAKCIEAVIFALNSEKDDSRFALLNELQRAAIARFLHIFRRLNGIEKYYVRDAQQALDTIWHQYLAVRYKR